ncbi:Hypothetical predicted protein [Cloeon dipterum]|nr:Hypothetical predicted protein [Cloeon dipterum]
MTGLQRSILFGLQILVLLIALDGAVAKDDKTTTKRATTTKKPTTTKPPTTTTPKKTTTTKPPITTTGKTTTTKPTTTKPTPPSKLLQCASVDFMSLQNKCCSPPANNLLANSYNKTIETACQNFGVDNSVFNFFVLVKLQNIILKNNTVNLNDILNLAGQLGQSACYIECYLNQSGAIDSTGAINVDALTALLVANQDPAGPWDEIITMAVSQCTSVMSKLPLQFVPPGLLSCNPTGGLIAQCVLAIIVDQCPSRVTSAPCSTNYALYDECKQLITSVFSNGR